MNEIEKYLNIVNKVDFPSPVNKSIKNNLNKLYRENTPKLAGMEVIKEYHKSIWYCNRQGHKSPYDAWYDSSIMKKCIENRLKYKGDNLSLENLRYGLTTSKLAPKVSIFKPSLAKYLINKYLNQYNEIFDPCSGFSGRMLGAWSLNKKYIGQDINNIIVNESNNIIKDFNLQNVSIKQTNSLNTKGTYECLFTCSPYNDKENWNQDIENLTCDEWIDICLKNYNCKSYLFVVDKVEKYKKHIVEEIINKSNFGTNKEYIVLINNYSC